MKDANEPKVGKASDQNPQGQRQRQHQGQDFHHRHPHHRTHAHPHVDPAHLTSTQIDADTAQPLPSALPATLLSASASEDSGLSRTTPPSAGVTTATVSIPTPTAVVVEASNAEGVNTGAIMIRKRKQRGRRFLIIVAFLTTLTMLFMMFEYDPAESAKFDAEIWKHQQTAQQDGHSAKSSPTMSPEPLDWDQPEKEERHHSFSFWERHSSQTRIRNEEFAPSKNKKKKNPKNTKIKRHKAENNETVHMDKPPNGHDAVKSTLRGSEPDEFIHHAPLPAGTILRAADALVCEATVIDYVINATDSKDECDGLIKAFEATCTEMGEEESAEDEAIAAADGAADGDDDAVPNAAAGRRRLSAIEPESRIQSSWPSPWPISEWEQSGSSSRHRSRQHRSNPIRTIQNSMYHFNKRIQHWFREKPVVLDVEDEIEEEFSDAFFEVQNDLNDAAAYSFRKDIDRKRIQHGVREMSVRQQKRKLQESETVQTTPPVHVKENKTATPHPRPRTSLALPMSNSHVSDKVLEESLLLQNKDTLLAHAVRASANQTGADAGIGNPKHHSKTTQSAKAVADTLEVVNAVLNDPTSVEARACCTSILSVYNENCSSDDEEELSDRRLFIVVAVIALCGLVKSLIRHFKLMWLPEAAGCILVGVISGWILMYYPHHDISFDGAWFLRIMVPPIVFEAAVSIDKRSFNRHIVPIIFFAVIGTIFATAVTAIIVHKGSQWYHGYCETIPYIDALAFGALISSIDPIAVLSVLSNMGMTDTDTIYVLIFGESLLNDGVAIVLFQTLVHFLDDHLKVDANAIIAATVHFFVVACGSLVIGVVSGYCATFYFWMMHGCQTPLVEVIMFFCWALIPYYICDGIEWSGIVAVVATGFVMDMNIVGRHANKSGKAASFDRDDDDDGSTSTSLARSRRPITGKLGHLSLMAKTHVGFVTEIVATTMETAIFAYLGLFLFSSRYHWNFHHTMLAIAGCSVSRGLMIPILSTIANCVIRMQQGNEHCQRGNLPQHANQAAASGTGGGGGRPAGVVIDKKMQIVLWFAGLRGAMSFALVEDIPLYNAATGRGSRVKSELKAMTSASILFTVFILGGGTYYMMEILGLAPKSNGNRTPKRNSVEMTSLLKEAEKTSDHDDEMMGSNFSSDGGGGGGGGGNTFRQRNPARDCSE